MTAYLDIHILHRRLCTSQTPERRTELMLRMDVLCVCSTIWMVHVSCFWLHSCNNRNIKAYIRI